MISIIKKLIEYIFYLFIFLLPLQTRWIVRPQIVGEQYWEFGTISLYAADILISIVLILFIALCAADKSFLADVKKRIFSERLVFSLLAAFLLICGFSTVFALDKITAAAYFARLCLGVFIFFLVYTKVLDFKYAISVFLSSIFIEALAGNIFFITQTSIASKWLGMALHDAGSLGASVIETCSDGSCGRWLRAYGTLDHPNIFGGFMAIGAFLFLSSILSAAVKVKKNTIRYAGLLLCSSGIAFSSSRSAILSFFVSGCAIGLLLFKQKSAAKLKNFISAAICLAALACVVSIFYGGLFTQRINIDSRLEAKSMDERGQYIRQSLELIKHNFAGAGLGNYGLVYAQAFAQTNSLIFFQQRPIVHNSYLLIAVEAGIIGLVIFLAFLIVLFVKRFRSLALYEDKGGVPLYLPLIPILLIIMLFDHWPWSLHFGVFAFWLVLGLAFDGE